jgi:hypothetical protein
MSRRPIIKPSRITRGQWILCLVSAVTLALVLYLVNGRAADHRTQDDLGRTVSALSTGMAQNQARLKELGERPVGPPAASISAGKATPPPTEDAPVTPGSTKTTTVGPTDAQVRTAVRAYFADHPIKTPQIDPQDLAPQVTRYVAKYLTEHPPAAGKPGTDGDDGAAGATGPSGAPCDPATNTGCVGPSGARGPGPTDEQVATAVAVYLPGAVADYLTANPPPAGPAGPSGAPCDPGTNPACVGPSGERGPGPTSDQIRTAVSDYIASHPVPPCSDGYEQTTQQVVTAGGTVTAQICTLPTSTAPTSTPS